MIEMIENTTNWYIRFNRKRLKGEYGKEDTLHALNSLFEVLFTIVRGMAPFVPFLTDNIYRRLRQYIPLESLPGNSESVHFLPFPEVREELFDVDVERKFSRMQKVIELARTSRERKAIGLKVFPPFFIRLWLRADRPQIPLKTLVVIHPDQSYLEEVKSLENYITSELNIRDLVLSSDEEKYGVEYRVNADWPVLGKKLKKNVGKVKNALPSITSAQVKQFVKDKEIEIADVKVVEGDLVVIRGLAQAEALKDMETNTDNDVLTILDTQLYPELESEGLAREVINRVQRLRKKAGLIATDDVIMEYQVHKDPVGLEKVFEEHKAMFEKALRRPLDTTDTTRLEAGEYFDKVILEEEQEIGEATFLLRLVKLH
jgi:isoleucyl-tRNA synthetase